ncbi:MAG: DUF3500 domain-containing protein, partial [Akkermansiaceae bacterium]|nr:DUF3500 domain-containing protein [Akkermansiaceae bacterium]
LSELQANVRETYFAWSGPTTPGSVAYFRIQGPTLVVEYDNTARGANHVHTVWRDPRGDFGDDVFDLSREYGTAAGGCRAFVMLRSQQVIDATCRWYQDEVILAGAPRDIASS